MIPGIVLAAALASKELLLSSFVGGSGGGGKTNYSKKVTDTSEFSNATQHLDWCHVHSEGSTDTFSGGSYQL